MSYVAVGIAAAGLAYNIYSSESKKSAAKKALAKIESQPYPKFLTPQEIDTQAKEMAKEGFTPEEQAAFKQQLARASNTAYQKNLNVAPGLAQATLAGLNYSKIGAMNDFAARDAQLHQQNIERMRGLIGGQDQLQTGTNLNRRNSLEQAYGQAIQDQSQNTNQAINQFGTSAASAYQNKQYIDALKTQNQNQGMSTQNISQQQYGNNYFDDQWGGGYGMGNQAYGGGKRNNGAWNYGYGFDPYK